MVFAKVVVEPTHTFAVPEIAGTTGRAIAVTFTVAVFEQLP